MTATVKREKIVLSTMRCLAPLCDVQHRRLAGKRLPIRTHARLIRARWLIRRARRLSHRADLAQDIDRLVPQPLEWGEDALEWEWARTAFLAGVSRPGIGSPGWLVSLAARIIPTAERLRYREEFEAELLEIAGGWRRFGHAARVLVRAVPLRWELRRPARERAR